MNTLKQNKVKEQNWPHKDQGKLASANRIKANAIQIEPKGTSNEPTKKGPEEQFDVALPVS